jgi:hypothetical protein
MDKPLGNAHIVFHHQGTHKPFAPQSQAKTTTDSDYGRTHYGQLKAVVDCLC